MKPPKTVLLYLLLPAAVLTVLTVLYRNSRPPAPRDLGEIRSEGILRIVTEYSRPGYFASGDTLEGFQYALGRAVSELSGLEIRIFLEMSLTASFDGLENNRYDVIARNLPVTSEMKDRYLFTGPVVPGRQVLVQRTAAANRSVPPLRNQLELAGKTLHIPGNSPVLLRIANLQHEIGDTVYTVQDSRYSSEQLMLMVAGGDIDYAVCDRRTAAVMQKVLPEIDIDTDIGFTQLQSWAVRKTSPALRDSLNRWFENLRKNGTCDSLHRRYYGSID